MRSRGAGSKYSVERKGVTMSDAMKAAILYAASVRAMIIAMAYQAENQQRAYRGEAPAYPEKAFLDMLEKENVTSEGIMGLLLAGLESRIK